jgi:hypothetical protein
MSGALKFALTLAVGVLCSKAGSRPGELVGEQVILYGLSAFIGFTGALEAGAELHRWMVKRGLQ